MYKVVQEDRPCLGRLVFVWGAYGLAMAALWHVTQGNPTAQALAWGIAALTGLCLLFGMRGF